ncbi:MAG: DUF4362 domain-containing protein [Oscillospiraceae bacterium]|nr:DUF4362 domain-containing protein [Oscillospiraceae bacterium]
MNGIFLSVLNMSLTGAFVVAVIFFARLPLKRAPKWISYCLWAVAAFRLITPFSFESLFSLVPSGMPQIDAPVRAYMPSYVENRAYAPDPVGGNYALESLPVTNWSDATAWVWLAGIAAMLIYCAISTLLLRRRLRESLPCGGNVYETDTIKTPLVFGLFRPRIYLPIGLSDGERAYILLHEQTHISRRDYLVKVFAFFVLCVHWFNPLAWLAFVLMAADMETSCDERVLRELGGASRSGIGGFENLKTDYATSLVRLAAERRIIGASPLAFGEGGVKERVKNVLKFKKPARLVIITAVVLAAGLAIGLSVNRVDDNQHFKGWTVENVASVDLSLNPPGTYVTVYDRGQIADIVNGILALDIGKATEEWRDMAMGGQTVQFNMRKADGEYIEIGVFTPYVIINEQSYEAKYESCEALNSLGNEIGNDFLADSAKYTSLYPADETPAPIAPELDTNIDADDQPSDGSLLSPLMILSDLPADYGAYENREKAISDGVYVNVQGAEIYNQATVDFFYKDFSDGKVAFMRTIEYTVEGDPIIKDYEHYEHNGKMFTVVTDTYTVEGDPIIKDYEHYEHDGKMFTVVTDTTRDKFGSTEIFTGTYKYLVPLDRSRPAGTPMQFYLSNSESIYESTPDGDGARLKDGLGMIPSPSDSVGDLFLTPEERGAGGFEGAATRRPAG